MVKIKNNEKGITLISLVITIILLLILATVAINLAIDSDGLFRKAGEAANKWNSSVEDEGAALENLMIMANSLGGTTPPPSTLPEGWDANKVVSTVKEGSRIAPIPKGYVASKVDTEDQISEGLVIYEKTDAIIEVNSSNHDTALTSCNQFVWIPVDDIDYMVMCKSNNKLADEDGNKTCDLEFVNGVLQCTNTAHTETATDLCGRLYNLLELDENIVKEGDKSVYTVLMSFTAEKRASQTWDKEALREPDIISSKDVDDTEDGTQYMVTAGITSGLVSDFEAQLKSDFKAMAESVAKYGGFYVARYEAGVNGASKKNQEVMVAGTSDFSGMIQATEGAYIEEENMWYGVYNKLRVGAEINKEAVSSHMIWGCQYDQVINFLAEDSSNEPFTGHTERQLNVQAKTGANSADEMSNIYDLEGNHLEWTAQAATHDARSHSLGGFFSASTNSYYPASLHHILFNSSAKHCIMSSRATLYM